MGTWNVTQPPAKQSLSAQTEWVSVTYPQTTPNHAFKNSKLSRAKDPATSASLILVVSRSFQFSTFRSYSLHRLLPLLVHACMRCQLGPKPQPLMTDSLKSWKAQSGWDGPCLSGIWRQMSSLSWYSWELKMDVEYQYCLNFPLSMRRHSQTFLPRMVQGSLKGKCPW